MAHPFNQHRQNKVEKSRVGHIAGHKHRASGGRAKHADEKQDRKLIGEMIHEHAEGKMGKHRRDRPMRAHGGKVGKKKGSHVNVIVNAGQHAPPMPMPPPAMGPPPGPPMPPPGLGAPAPGGPPPMPPGMPPGMPPRKRGGRISSDGHTAKPMRAKGGGVNAKSGPAWEEGKRLGTKVSHVPAKEVDIKNMDRPRVVSFNAGGKAVSFRARGGPVESNYKVASASKLSGGAGGGIGRREKARKYGYGKPLKEVDGAR